MQVTICHAPVKDCGYSVSSAYWFEGATPPDDADLSESGDVATIRVDAGEGWALTQLKSGAWKLAHSEHGTINAWTVYKLAGFRHDGLSFVSKA